MLVRTTLDSTVLRVGAADQTSYLFVHRTLLQTMLRHAYVVMASRDDVADLVREVKNAPVEVRKLWLEVLASKRLPVKEARPDRVPLSQITDLAALATNWRAVVRIAIANPERALALGVPPGAASATDDPPGVEVSRHDLVAHAECFTEAQRMAEDDIPAGTARDDLWRKVVLPMVGATEQRIAIMDRYAGHELIREQSAAAAGRSSTQSGISWFLHQVAGTTGRSLSVEAIVSETDDYDATMITTAFARLWPDLSGGRIASLSVAVTARGRGGDAGHPRHIRFDHRVLVLDKGISLFTRPITDASVPWKYQANGSQDALERERVMTRFQTVVWQSP